MVPSTPQRRSGNSSRVNLLISFVVHAVVVGALTFFAAREGLLGTELKKIAVQMVKEKPPEPEKPKEPEKPVEKPADPEKAPDPEPDPEPETTPPPATANPTPPPTTTANAGIAAPPAIAPPANAMPAFVFGGGRAVQSSSDPVQVYRGLLEFALRARWNRPTDLADTLFVAEVEVAVDGSGRIRDPEWRKGSGNERWDASVRAAIAATPSLTRPPPTHFPPRVLVRFDVQEEVAEATPTDLGSP
jgi:outer membrane biosynthesis protein TonB